MSAISPPPRIIRELAELYDLDPVQQDLRLRAMGARELEDITRDRLARYDAAAGRYVLTSTGQIVAEIYRDQLRTLR